MKRAIARRAPRAVVERAVRVVDDGVRLVCTARPGAREDAIDVGKDGGLAIAVRAQPKDGEANDAIVDVIAHAVGVARRDVSLVRGHRARAKELAIAGVARDDVVTRLAEESAAHG